MKFYQNYRLVEEAGNLYLEVYLDPGTEEFSLEFLKDDQGNTIKFEEQIRQLIDENFSEINIQCVRLFVGSILVGTLCLLSTGSVFAAETVPSSSTVPLTATTGTLDWVGTVTATKLYVRSGPSSTNTIINALYQGNSVKIIGQIAGWYQVRLADGTVGWSSAQYITLNLTGKVTATKLNIRSTPSSTGTIIHALYQGNSVKVIGQSGSWYQVKLTDGRIAWASAQYITLNAQEGTPQEKTAAILNYAKSFLGTPYVYGSSDPANGGMDCSGFVYHVFSKFGYTLSRVSRDQALNGTYVPKDSIQSGDLLFFSNAGNGVVDHVGIYLGDGKMIHSPKTGDVVKISDMTTSYWTGHYITSRRIIP